MVHGMLMTLCGTRREEVENRQYEWRRAMEDRGIKITVKKTVYLRFNGDGNSDMKKQGENLERVKPYKGPTLAEN